MKNIFTILRRELSAYFNSTIAYIYLIVFIIINNGLFMSNFFLIGKADMRFYFESLPYILLVFIPAITMRLWAEDRKENTFELLMTFPIRPTELVLGKFLASFCFYLLSLVATITVPIILYACGKPDLGVILGGYIGALFIGALFLSIGIFASGLTKEQIVSFVITMLCCFLIYFCGTDFIAASLDGWLPGVGTFLKNFFGAASRLTSLSKGVIDIKDIIYFAVLSFVFIVLNGAFLEGRMRPKMRAVFSIMTLVCIVSAVIINWLIQDLNLGRFDLTKDKIYTISESSKNILRNLKVPVLLKLYFTPAERMPTAFKTLEKEVTAKLDELKVFSNNKLKFDVYHIEAANLIENNKKQDKDEGNSLEKSLHEKGIAPFQVESINKDEVGVKLIYAAITIAYKEKNEEIMQRILPQTLNDLEYLLFSRIKKLTLEKKPKIVLFSPLKSRELTPEMDQLLRSIEDKNSNQYEDNFKNIVPLLRNNGYQAERITLTKENPIPNDSDIIFVINPGALNDRQLFEINKFLYQGGSLLIASQGYDYSFSTGRGKALEVAPQKLNLNINNLIEKWGTKINDEMLMDENLQIINAVTDQKVGPFSVSMPLKIPNQILIKDDTINKNIPLMSRISSLFYVWGSSLDISDELTKQLGLQKTILWTSSNRSWKVPFTENGNLKEENMEFTANSKGKFPLAVFIKGQFPNNFVNQNLPDWPAKTYPKTEADTQQQTQATPAITPSKAEISGGKPGNLFVIGCSKMFDDDLLSNPGNLSLFANLIDGLALGDDIIQIRSKSPLSLYIKKLTDTQKLTYRFITIFLVPILLVIYAALRLLIRRKEKQFFMQAKED